MLKSFLIGIMVFLYPCISHSQIYMEMAMDTSMTYTEIVEEAESFFDKMGKGSHTGYKAFKRWEYWMKRCLDPSGKMITGAMVDDRYQEFMASQGNIQPSVTEANWETHGPIQARTTSGWSSHIGRITSLSVDPQNMDHMIVGSPTGGVWKTLDAGNTWTPISDKESVLKIYSLEISPHNSDHYYAGTWGGGVMRSIDGGQTWFSTNGIFGNARINSIIVSPDNPDHVLVINEGGNIFKSFNGGDLWNNRFNSPVTLYDIEFKPGNSNVIYASGEGRVYTSVDAGISFTEIQGPWLDSGLLFNPIMLAVTEADPEYLYVLEADSGGFGALYLSVDGGDSFETRSHNFDGGNNVLGYVKGVRGGQAPRDMAIAVNPLNKSEVHVGGVMSFRSMDSGSNWVQTSHWLRNDPLPFIHADIDKIVYKEGRVFFCTDGGLFTSDNSAITFTDRTTGLNVRQFYRMDIESDSSGQHIIVAGSQDNGMGRFIEGEGWLDFIGADGMEPIIEKTNPDIIYGSIQYGNIYKTITGGTKLAGGVRQSPGLGDWVTPLEKDPFLPYTMYQGKKQLYRSADGSATWTAISDFQMKNPQDTFMQELAISQQDNNVLVAGFEEQMFRTVDGGVTWRDITPNMSLMNVNYISIHPHDKNRIAITMSGTSERVMETLDGGVTWESIHLNLPDIASECVIYEGGPNDGMYVSMDVGIYYRNNAMPQWEIISGELPNVKVTELEIQDCMLYACTFGRGLWSTGIIDNDMLYADNDGDGYGDESTGVNYCLAPENYIALGGDCNDTDRSINPAAIEACDEIDNNCDGIVDEGGTITNYYVDADGDGYGDDDIVVASCEELEGYVLVGGDCNDDDSSINPAAIEACDDLDNNCDGIIDEGITMSNYYEDADGDGYGNDDSMIVSCDQLTGYVLFGGDCNDNDAGINPESVEACDEIDNNCDGVIDEGCQIELEDCDGNFLVVHFITQSAYSAHTQIVADAKVSNDQVFKAGEEIILLPEFEIALGAEFLAQIEPCSFGVQSSSADNFKEFVFIEESMINYFEESKEIAIYIQNAMGEKIYEDEAVIQDIGIVNVFTGLEEGMYKLTVMQGNLILESELSILPYKKIVE